MSSSATLRKPLGVRATPEQHRLLTEAAARDHRSVSSFVLNAALKAAKPVPESSHQTRSQEDIDAAIRRAQELMRPYKKAGHSLVDDLLAERRAEAALE